MELFLHNNILALIPLLLLLPSYFYCSLDPFSKPSGVNSVSFSHQPQIIAHRGDSFQMPENTIPAFEHALEKDDVDFIDTDLLLTKDLILVCYHDLTLASGTDVRSRPEFAHLHVLHRNITYDGLVYPIEDEWLLSDFTLEELKQLQVVTKHRREPWPISIPTFDEFLDTVKRLSWKRFSKGNKAPIGIMPELKHPSYYNAITNTSHFMESLVIKKLEGFGYSFRLNDGDEKSLQKCEYKVESTVIPCNPLILQSWEPSTIKYLHDEVDNSLRLLTVLWTNNVEYLTWSGMASLAGKTEFVGLYTEFLKGGGAKKAIEDARPVVNYDKGKIEQLGGLIPPEKMVAYVEQLGMKVAAYTIVNTTTEEELEFYFGMGVHAFFVEGLERTVKIRNGYFAGRKDKLN